MAKATPLSSASLGVKYNKKFHMSSNIYMLRNTEFTRYLRVFHVLVRAMPALVSRAHAFASFPFFNLCIRMNAFQE